MKDIERVIQRSRRSLYTDGIADLYLGSIFFLTGLFLLTGLFQLIIGLIIKGIGILASWIASSFNKSTNPRLLTLLPWLFICLFAIFLSLFCYLLMKMSAQGAIALKERFTYPRVGYVTPHILPLHQRLMMGILSGAGFILINRLAPHISKSLPPEFLYLSLLGTFLFLYPAVILTQNRYYILTALSTLLLVVLFQAKIENGRTIYMTLMGVALIISGGFTFRNFLRQNPLPKDELQ